MKTMMLKATNNGEGKQTFKPLLNIGQHKTEAATALQAEILNAYAQLSRTWFAHAQSQAALWAEFWKKAALSRSLSEIVEAHRQCVQGQMQLTTKDTQNLIHQYKGHTTDLHTRQK